MSPIIFVSFLILLVFLSSSSSSSSSFSVVVAETTTTADQTELDFGYDNNDNPTTTEEESNIESTICPPGSTVDGSWGLSRFQYNTRNFYREDQKTQPEHVFGSWLLPSGFTGSGRQARAAFMNQMCRRYKSLSSNKNNNNNNNKKNEKETEQQEQEQEQRFPFQVSEQDIATSSECEWQKPLLQNPNFVPFDTHPAFPAFSLNRTAIIYSANNNQNNNNGNEISVKQLLQKILQSVVKFESDSKANYHNYKNNLLLTKTAVDQYFHLNASIGKPLIQYKRASQPPKKASQLSFCYDFQNPARCLKNRVILFVGDSHVLNIAQVLCRMILKRLTARSSSRNFNISDLRYAGSVCGELDIRFTPKVTIVNITRTNTTIVMFRTRYFLQDQFQKRFDPHPLAESLKRDADFVVYGCGLWHTVYKDTNRKRVTLEFASSLKFLAQQFPKARIIAKFVHYDHKFMDGCDNTERMMQLRDSNICGTYIAAEEVAQVNRLARKKRKNINNNKDKNQENAQKKEEEEEEEQDPYRRFSILDIYGASRETQYYIASDFLGHHWSSVWIESMVQHFLGLICPSQPQNHTLIFQEFAKTAKKLSCHRMLHNTSSLAEPICACNVRGISQTVEAKDFCNNLRKRSYLPFVVDT